MVIYDTRTFQEFHTDRMAHASIVAIRHATGHFVGRFAFDAVSAGKYATIAAHEAFVLHPELRDL